MSNPPIWLTGNADADRLLSEDDNALLLGMVLDQQVPMEKAFTGPYVIAQRMGGALDVAAIAEMEEDDFVAICSERPAVHRFPGSMGKRVRQACQLLVERYDGDAGKIWARATTGAELRTALLDVPGIGADKASIFVAVLGKLRGVRPEGWQQAAGKFGELGSYVSVADVSDPESLAKVRQAKKAAKAAVRAAQPGPSVPTDRLTGGR